MYHSLTVTVYILVWIITLPAWTTAVANCWHPCLQWILPPNQNEHSEVQITVSGELLHAARIVLIFFSLPVRALHYSSSVLFPFCFTENSPLPIPPFNTTFTLTNVKYHLVILWDPLPSPSPCSFYRRLLVIHIWAPKWFSDQAPPLLSKSE